MLLNVMEVGFCNNSDRSFGPTIPSECRDGFDFTLLFENIFFSILPAIALLSAVSIRLWRLRTRNLPAPNTLLQLCRQSVAVSESIARLVILIIWALPSTFRTRLSTPAAVFNLAASLSTCVLSYEEGRKSVRPSCVLNFYLLGSGLLDAVQLRTLWLARTHYAGFHHIAIAGSVHLGLKVVLLILEATPKQQRESHIPPEDMLGIYSLRTFWWLNGILRLGRAKQLEPSDLFPIDSGLKTSKYSPQLIERWKTVDQEHEYALLGAVVTTLKWPLLAPIMPRLILIGFTYAQPLLIKRALKFVEQSVSKEEQNIGYGLIGATALVYCGIAIFNGYHGHLLYRSITIVRGSLIDIIYHKSLQIELTAAQEAAPAGLVTADLDRMDITIERMHSLWASVVELGIATYLLQIEVGWACIGPIIVTLCCTLSTSFISKLLPNRQKKWNQAIQKRVGLTSTMLSNMKTVKMMGLSNYIANTLQAARMAELVASAAFRRCMAVVNVTVLIPKQISAPVTFTLYVLAVNHGLQGGKLSASRAFTVLTIIELITAPLGLALQAIPSITASVACLNRIQAYLKSPVKDERHSRARHSQDTNSIYKVTSPTTEKPEATDDNTTMISIKNATFAYRTSPIPALDSTSLNVPSHSITAVVGPVGSGKSTLLKSILGELEIRTGAISVRSERIGYCDQNPWIRHGTVRNSITGISEFNGPWFDEVVHACALEEDLCSLADGADTEIGSRGIALSEGQRHRVALARAIYSRAPLLVLDDVFRSLDASTESTIFERLFSPDGLLRRCDLTAVIVTHNSRHLAAADQVIVLEQGIVSQKGSFNDLKSRDGYIRDNIVHSESVEHGKEIPSTVTSDETSTSNTTPKRALRPKQNTPARQIGPRGRSIYIFYLKPIGVFRLMVLLVAVVTLALATRFQRIWVQWWTEADDRESMYIGVYFLVAVGACLSFAFFFWWMWMFVVPVTAGGLHEKLLKSIINAPLAYFTTVDSGVILNRFSQDMAIINGQLPVNIFQAISIFMICLIQIAFIAYGSKYLAIAIPVTLIVLWILVHYYLLTSQQLRVIDIELKAPIYTSLTETKEGLATIRAFGWQSAYEKDCQARIDESKKAIYMLFMVQRWLNFVLDLIVAGLATVLMTLATQLRRSTDPAALGVGLSSVIGFSVNMSQFIVCYTELENSLGAISRIKDCVDNIETEDSAGSSKQQPPDGWPSLGTIEFSNVTASYNDDENLALDEICFSVSPGQKVCICGRTGSGKSTLMSAVLRLLEIQSGKILIDGIEISTILSEAVRKNINVIPQTPFFLPGSVRLNLSASSQTSEAMIAALQKVDLWETISARGGLEAEMSQTDLSHGQQQLFCLAAAILKQSKVVLIDEATSGVDVGTERKMCDLIREEFRDCTVISISHQLRTVMDYDLVVVLSQGRCVEKGEPRALLEKEGEFWKLVNS